MAERIVIPGDPGALGAIGSQLRTAAADVASVRDRVASNSLDGAWKGNAANAFRSTLHELPGELSHVVSAFEQAGGAVSRFASRLGELQREAAWYNAKLAESEEEERLSRERLKHAETSVLHARAAHSAAADPASILSTRSALAACEAALHGAVGALEEAGAALSHLVSGASGPRQEYEAAVRQCCGELDAAHGGATHGLSGWVARHLQAMEHGLEHLGGAIWRAGTGEIDSLVHDGEHLLKWAGHELDEHWDTIRNVLMVAGTVIAAATIVALIVVSGGTALPGVIGFLTVAGVADSAAVLLGDERESRLPQYANDRKLIAGDMFSLVTSLLGPATKGVGLARAALSDGGVAAKGLTEAEQVAKELKADGPIEGRLLSGLEKSPAGKRVLEDLGSLSTRWEQAAAGANAVAKSVGNDLTHGLIDHLAGSKDPYKTGLGMPIEHAPEVVQYVKVKVPAVAAAL
jgi:uncharacterized protein YukE